MATVTLRPTSASGTSWSNTANVYDGSTSTSATVSVSSSNYTSRTLTCNFDTSVIPGGATINSATLTIIANQSSSTSSRRITVRCAVNGGTTYAINTQLTSTTATTLTGDITSSMSSLSTIVVTGYRSSTTSTTFTVYELYIDVDYTAGADAVSNIYLGDSNISDLFLGEIRILKAYLGDFLLYSYGTSESGGDSGGDSGGEDNPFDGTIVISLVAGRELDPSTGNIGSASSDGATDLIALKPGTYTFTCSSECWWLAYAIYNYDTEAYESGNDEWISGGTGGYISFTLTANKKVRLGANIEDCDNYLTDFTLTTTDGGLV